MKNLLIVSFMLLSQLSFAQKGQADKASQEKQSAEAMAKLQEMMAGIANAETRPVYIFPIAMTMRVTEYRGGAKKDATDIKYHVNGAEETFAFAGMGNKNTDKNMMVVYDSKKSTMVMVDLQKKTYFAMNISTFKDMEQKMSGSNSKSDIKCSSSGKTKTIQGYSCEQFVCLDKQKDSRAELWVTDKIPVDIAQSFKGSPIAAFFDSIDGVAGMKGMMMEGKFYEKGELQSSIEIAEISTKSNQSITLSNYKKSDMFGGR